MTQHSCELLRPESLRLSIGSQPSGEDPELASYLRIEERELEAGGLN
jgi:hypothetical protein